MGRRTDHLFDELLTQDTSTRYRAILRKLVEVPFATSFKRSDIRGRLSNDEARVLDNFLARMKALGVVRPDPEQGPGAYCFENLLHDVYFNMEASRAPETREVER